MAIYEKFANVLFFGTTKLGRAADA